MSADRPSWSEESIEKYIQSVLRDNWVPRPDNTRMDPYDASARAIRMSVMGRLSGAPSPSYWTGVVSAHLNAIRTSVEDDAIRRNVYQAALTAYIGLSLNDVFDRISIGADMVLVSIMDDLDILTVGHLDTAIAEAERSILNWRPGSHLGSLDKLAKAHVLMIHKRRQLALKEETCGDEDN